MKRYALNLGENGRILSCTFQEFAAEGQPIVDALPEGDITDYLYDTVTGEYTYDPLPRPDPKPDPEERIAELEAALEALLNGDTDD